MPMPNLGSPRPMRIPQSWDDRDILQDEPLCSAFRKQKLTKSNNWIGTKEPIIKLLRGPKNCKSVEAWLNHAFSSSTSRRSQFPVDQSTATFFLDFFWYLYGHDDSACALKYLDFERVRRGLPKFSANALMYTRTPGTSLTASVAADSEEEIHSPQNTSHSKVLPIRSRKGFSRTKPAITSSSIQKIAPSSLTTSKTINPSTSHVGNKHRYPGLHFTKITKVESSGKDSGPTFVPNSESSALPSLGPESGECNHRPIFITPRPFDAPETSHLTKVVKEEYSGSTLLPNEYQMDCSSPFSALTDGSQFGNPSRIPEKRPATPLHHHEAKRRAVTREYFPEETHARGTEVSAPSKKNFKGKDMPRAKKGRPSSTSTTKRRSGRSNKVIKIEDTVSVPIANSEMNPHLPPLVPETKECDHSRISVAPTALETSETLRNVPDKKQATHLDNHEGKRHAVSSMDTPKQTHIEGAEVSATSKRAVKGKNISRLERGWPSAVKKSGPSNKVLIMEDIVSNPIPNSEMNSKLPPLVRATTYECDHSTLSVPPASLETSETPQFSKKNRYSDLRFNKSNDSRQTFLPNPGMSSELTSPVPLANECDHSAIFVAPMTSETSSNVLNKRPLDNHEARLPKAIKMDTSTETPIQGMEVSNIPQKSVKANGISRSRRGRPLLTRTYPQRSLRSNAVIKTEGATMFVPIPEVQSDLPVNSGSDGSPAPTRPTTLENPTDSPKKRLSTSSDRVANRRSISEDDGTAEMRVQGKYSVENVKVTMVRKILPTGSGPRPKKRRGQTETKNDAKTRTFKASSEPEVTMIMEEVIHVKAEALYNYQIRSPEPVLSPTPQFHVSESEDESLVLLTDLCEEELESAWIRPSFPSNLPEDPYQLPKPPLRILPPIWAESRQEICESFDWFRSYQGGVYHAHNVAKGYLLSAFPSSRDTFEHGGRLIISHGGGRAESLHSSKGQISSQPASDQMAQDKSVRALFDNYLNNRPLALVMDDKYALFPFDLRAKGIAYAVLGFYTIAHAWAEYQPANNESGRVVRFKFAFRWCEQQGTPWWNQELEAGREVPTTTKIQSQPSTPENFLSKDFYDPTVIMERKKLALVCELCHKVSLRIFDLSWACLNPDCQFFWRQPNEDYLPTHLEYHSNFLQLPPSRSIPVGFGSLAPPSPRDFLPGDNVTNYAFSRGFHCPDCGRLSCRDKWEKWECMNSGCPYSLPIQCIPRDAQEFLYQTESMGFKDHSINAISEIVQIPPTSFVHEYGRGILHTFLLPHDGAKIHHIQSGNALGRKEADVIFRDYQTQATHGSLKFRRWPMRAHKCRGALLTNYFSQNSGEPYKYVGGDANTVPFESAPDAVVKARALIQRRINQALGISAEFNEVLSAAYMERQRMAFHSDNEVGLGPLVAGLSLGSPALMHFRLHSKHDPEREKRGILLSVILRHGDILVMDGAGVQEYYEHTVVPDNFRIAATARQINAGDT